MGVSSIVFFPHAEMNRVFKKKKKSLNLTFSLEGMTQP